MGAKGEVNVKINFDSNLAELKKGAEQANLSDRQREAVNKYIRGAETAYKTGGLGSSRAFLDNYKNAAAVIQKGLIASGNISKGLQELGKSLTEVQGKKGALEKEREALSGKYVKDKTGKAALSVEGAKQYLNDFLKEKGKDIKSDSGHKLGPEEIAKRLDQVVQLLNGKNLSSLTNAQAKQAGFADRNTAFLASNFMGGMNAQATALATRDVELGGQISNYAQQETEIQAKINALGPASNEAAAGIEELYKKITNLVAVTSQQANPQIRQEAAAMGGGAAQVSTGLPQQASLGKALKGVALYQLALRSLKKLYREVISTVKELDKSLNEQAMVTGKTRKETYQLLETYQGLAKATGSTTKEVAEVTTQFIRQGKSVSEALTLTEAAISAAKVASISVSDSVNYLTTALNGFQMAAEDAMTVSDKFAAVAAQSATSYEEIATALSKVASQANLAGMSMDYTIALLAKGIETTREAPETIGTALKTVIARMREITDYGETLEDGLDINNVETQLNYVGVALRTATGELRSTEDVLDDLGKKWDTLNSNQQAAVAKALAGTRQQSRLIAMMSDYERVTELQQIAARSAGATSAQAATYLQGMEAAINNIKVSIEEITTGLANSDGIIALMNALAEILSWIATLTGWIGDSTASVYIFVVLMLSISSALLATKIKQWQMEKQVTAEKLKQAAATMISYWYVAVIVALIATFVLLIATAVANTESLNEKFERTNAEIYNLRKEIDAIDSGLSTFDKLSSKLIKTQEDAQAAADALHGISDSLSSETGKDVKDKYLEENNIKSDSQLYKKLENWNSQNQSLSEYAASLDDTEQEQLYRLIKENDILNEQTKRNDQLKSLRNSSEWTDAKDQEKFLNDNASIATAIAGTAKNNIYKSLAKEGTLTEDQKSAVETFTYGIIDNMSNIAKLELAESDVLSSELAKKFSKIYMATSADGTKVRMTLAEALQSDSTTLAESISIYKDALNDLSGEEKKAFETQFQELNWFASLSEGALELADSLNITTGSINDFAEGYVTLNKLGDTQFSASDWKKITVDVLEKLGNNNYNIMQVIEEYTDIYKLNVEQQQKLIEMINNMTIEQLSQTTDNLTSFESSIDKYYEYADKFSEMTTAEKEELASSLGMTEDLYRAIASGDYSLIRNAIGANEQLEETRLELIDTLNKQIAIQEALALSGDENAKAELILLKEKKNALEDINSLYAISYEQQYDREQKRLDAYKELLQEEADATKESLEDRKKAYEKYFESINQAAEDEDYYEEVDKLTNAMTALSASNTGEARTKIADLESQLNELNKERIQTLRERAQEKIIENIDDSINNIDENVEKLTESNQALLIAMTKDIENPSDLIGRLMANNIAKGTTTLGLQNSITDWQSVFGGILTSEDWNKLRTVTNDMIFEKDANNNIVINIDGQKTVVSESNTAALGEAIILALANAGIGL